VTSVEIPLSRVCSADPPRKRIDVVPLSHANGTPRLSLGNLTEGSPLAPRRALTVQQMYVLMAFVVSFSYSLRLFHWLSFVSTQHWLSATHGALCGLRSVVE